MKIISIIIDQANQSYEDCSYQTNIEIWKFWKNLKFVDLLMFKTKQKIWKLYISIALNSWTVNEKWILFKRNTCIN